MNDIEKEFVPYKEALALKELGFNEPCFGWWFADEEMLIIDKSTKSTSENIIQAPTFSQAFRWFREKYGLYYPINVDLNGIWYYEKFTLKGFKTYEEAELACLRKLISIVKEKV
jgi:hypothetical protein